MIILGIDPGTRATGYGIIKYQNNAFTKIASGIINLSPSSPIPVRLRIIYDSLDKLIKTYKQFEKENN